jgi:hypothetical protein
MKAVGITAVRTGPVTDPELLALADSLGIVMYRELPLRALTTDEMLARTAEADSLIRLMLGSPAAVRAGPIGLLRHSDTDAEAACEWIAGRRRTVIERSEAMGAASPVPAYYVSLFDRPDACADRVDFVLLDVLSEPDPVLAAAAWRRDSPVPVGLGLVGISVGRHAVAPVGSARRVGRGLAATYDLSPGSAEPRIESFMQARYLERALSDIPGSTFRAVFVYRWRDVEPARRGADDLMPSGAGDLSLTGPAAGFGLYDVDYNPRPALQVVRGFYTGERNVFVFPTALRSPVNASWFTLAGWGLILVLVVVYSTSPLMRMMVPRYFLSHGFYRNAVREAREVLPLTSTALMTVIGLIAGMIGALIVTTFAESDVVRLLLARLPSGVHAGVLALIRAPVIMTVLLGSLYLLLTALWITIWLIIVRQRAPLLPSQALMLAVWPRWALPVLLPAAMVIDRTGPIERPIGVIILAVFWILAEFQASVRTTLDLSRVTGVGGPIAFLVWILNPVIVASIGGLILALVRYDVTGFLVRLAAG